LSFELLGGCLVKVLGSVDHDKSGKAAMLVQTLQSMSCGVLKRSSDGGQLESFRWLCSHSWSLWIVRKIPLLLSLGADRDDVLTTVVFLSIYHNNNLKRVPMHPDDRVVLVLDEKIRRI
jgi:hypothetical protein